MSSRARIEYEKRRIDQRKRDRLCTGCPAALTGRGTRCPPCAAAHTAHDRARRAEARAKGICQRCGQALRSWELMRVGANCDRCREANRESYRAKRAVARDVAA